MKIKYPTTEAGGLELAERVIAAAKKTKGPFTSDVRKHHRGQARFHEAADRHRKLSIRAEEQEQDELKGLKDALRLRAKALENRARGDKRVLLEAGYSVEQGGSSPPPPQ